VSQNDSFPNFLQFAYYAECYGRLIEGMACNRYIRNESAKR